MDYSKPYISRQKSPDNYSDEFYFQWHITEKCNLRCSHCYQANYISKNEMSLLELKGVADQISRTLNKWKKKGRIALTGGEPMTNSSLFPLVKYLEKSDEIEKIGILTNGTLINEKTIENIKAISKLHYIQVSLDGATPESNDKIRGKGSFQKAMNAIRLLKRNDITTRLMFTIHKENADEVDQFIDLSISEGIDGVTFERLVPCGQGKNMENLILSPEELQASYQRISDRADLEYERGSKLTILKLRTLFACLDKDGTRDGADIPFKKQLGAMCSIGIDSLCFLPDGTVLPCRRLNIAIGNLRTDSIFKIWYTSELLWKIRDKRNLQGKCKECDLIPRCSGCRAMAYTVTGNYLAEDPQCWN
jgi:radical SAM protein with 4Fe4S-binding SPASM domain